MSQKAPGSPMQWVPMSAVRRSRADLSLERSGQPPSRCTQSSLPFVWRSPEVLHGPSFSSISACCMSPCSLSLELSAWWGRKDLKQSYFTENVSQVSLAKEARSGVERGRERWIDVLSQGSVACCLLTQIKVYWRTTVSICFQII